MTDILLTLYGRFHACRRTQLVLLERALGVMTDMAKARVQADAAVWNALVGAAGRAGQLQRAFNVVEDMLVGASVSMTTPEIFSVLLCGKRLLTGLCG